MTLVRSSTRSRDAGSGPDRGNGDLVPVGTILTSGPPSVPASSACHCALLSTLLDSKGTEAERTASAAVDALRQAVAAGYDMVHPLEHDPRLASLRRRGEFQQMLQWAETNARRNKVEQ